MFTSFTAMDIDTGKAILHLRVGEHGRALFLLHGFPEMHLMWHAVSGLLAADFAAVVPDLRR
jgi:haloacetate dehalogenase